MKGSSFFKPEDQGSVDWIARQMASAVDSVPLENNTAILIDDGDATGLMVGAWTPQEDIDQDWLNGFLADTGIRAIGMAIRLRWTNDVDLSVPTSDAWFLTCVAGEDAPPYFCARNVEGGKGWSAIAAEDAPFLALSTASSLRHMLRTGEALVVKHAAPPAPGEGRNPLLNSISDDADWPKEQADGRL